MIRIINLQCREEAENFQLSRSMGWGEKKKKKIELGIEIEIEIEIERGKPERGFRRALAVAR